MNHYHLINKAKYSILFISLQFYSKTNYIKCNLMITLLYAYTIIYIYIYIYIWIIISISYIYIYKEKKKKRINWIYAIYIYIYIYIPDPLLSPIWFLYIYVSFDHKADAMESNSIIDKKFKTHYYNSPSS